MKITYANLKFQITKSSNMFETLNLGQEIARKVQN